MANHALATVTNPSSALTDFTLIVDLADMPANWWAAVDTSDGTRGRVYKGDGSTRLACDWIDFDDTAETGLLRVLWSGTLATSGTQQLWIEPPVSGNATVAASATYGSDNAYDSSIISYYPLTSDGNDRTSNGADLTANGSPSYTSGLIGDSVTLNGSNQWFDRAFTQASLPVSVIGAFKTDTAGNAITGLYDSSSHSDWLYMGIYGPASPFDDFDAWDRTNNTHLYLSADLDDDTWHVGGISWSGTGTDEFAAYIDTTSGAQTNSTDSMSGFDVLSVGRHGDVSPNAYWPGEIQHIMYLDVGISETFFDHERLQLSDNSTFWGTWSWVSTGGTDALTGDAITGGTPTLDTPALGQVHVLTGDAITSGTPTLDTPAIGQVHALAGDAITGGTPTLDTPAIGQVHALTGGAITGSAPTLDGPALGQVHILTADEITGGVPTLDSPTLAEAVDILTGADLLVGVPILDSPTLGQVHALTGSDILLGAWVIDTPSLSDFLYLFAEEFTGTSVLTTTKDGTSALTTEYADTSALN